MIWNIRSLRHQMLKTGIRYSPSFKKAHLCLNFSIPGQWVAFIHVTNFIK